MIGPAQLSPVPFPVQATEEPGPAVPVQPSKVECVGVPEEAASSKPESEDWSLNPEPSSDVARRITKSKNIWKTSHKISKCNKTIKSKRGAAMTMQGPASAVAAQSMSPVSAKIKIKAAPNTLVVLKVPSPVPVVDTESGASPTDDGKSVIYRCQYPGCPREFER